MWVYQARTCYHGVSLPSWFLPLFSSLVVRWWAQGYLLNFCRVRCRTLFWAGDTFAPKVLVEDRKGGMVSIQKFLQDAYLAMSETVVKAIGDLDGVLGFEVCHDMT